MEDKITNIKKLLLKNIDSCIFISISSSISENVVLDSLARKLDNGSKMILFKNINLNDKDFIVISQKAKQLCAMFGALFFIYKRCDYVKIIDADGIILDNSSLSLNQIQMIIDNDKIYGFHYENQEKSSLIIENFDFILANKIKNNSIKTILKEDILCQ